MCNSSGRERRHAHTKTRWLSLNNPSLKAQPVVPEVNDFQLSVGIIATSILNWRITQAPHDYKAFNVSRGTKCPVPPTYSTTKYHLEQFEVVNDEDLNALLLSSSLRCDHLIFWHSFRMKSSVICLLQVCNSRLDEEFSHTNNTGLFYLRISFFNSREIQGRPTSRLKITMTMMMKMKMICKVPSSPDTIHL